MIRSIIQMIVVIIAFNLGPPGVLIQRAILGFRNAVIQKKVTITPAISKIIFVVSICFHFFILVLPQSHMLVFLLRHP